MLVLEKNLITQKYKISEVVFEAGKGLMDEFTMIHILTFLCQSVNCVYVWLMCPKLLSKYYL